MVSSDPYHGTGPTSTRVKHRRNTSLSPHIASGSGAQVTSSKVARGTQNRYHTRELLGRGGMSEVYRGFDVRLRRPVAIKRLRSDAANNPVFRARFRREAEAAGRLHHSAIVAIYDTGEDPDATGRSIPFIVMELVEGCTLREELHEAGKLPAVQALEVTAAVLDALACSHAAGIIHRDVKPANVMLSNTGEIKVADFGIARPAAETTGTVTLAGTVLGTPQYLSPEQGRGEPVDERSDLYSVGCMLFELLAGAPPFGGDSPLSIVVQHISNAPTSPSAVNADISGDIDSIVLKALAKDPADRYQTASEMKADIESVLSGNRPAATALLAAPTVELSRPPGSHVARTDRVKATHVLAVVTAVLFVVVGASAFSVYRSSPPVTATHGSTEVPAVLGLGKVGARSLLRNARLVPRFELVHGPDGESVGTVIKQSPDGGDAVDTDSAVLVVINIGPSPDDPNLTYPERTNRRPTEPLSVRSSDTFRPNIEERPADSRTAQGDTSTGAQPSPAGDSGGKSEKGKKHGKSG